MKELIYMTDPYDQPVIGDRVIERKVTVASIVTLLFSILAAILVAIQNNPQFLLGLPIWLQFILITAVPPLLTFAAGYSTPSNRLP